MLRLGEYPLLMQLLRARLLGIEHGDVRVLRACHLLAPVHEPVVDAVQPPQLVIVGG